MLDEALRQRLEALNRGELPNESCATLNKPRSQNSSTESLIPGRSQRVGKPIPGIVQLGDVITTSAGEHLRIRLPIDLLWPNGSKLVAGRHSHLRRVLDEARRAVEPNVVMDAELAALVSSMPEQMILLDLETCGLGGAALFLVGLLRTVDGAPTVELLLARNYAEEQAVLETLWRTMASHNVLVTFNGKSFDWPLVIDRSIRYRLDAAHAPQEMLHIDVLHHARRRWRRQLPDCRLQTLEQVVCRRKRVGDVPGHRIPAAYAEFVRTGFERDMESILYHNAMDLVTLLDLALRLAG